MKKDKVNNKADYIKQIINNNNRKNACKILKDELNVSSRTVDSWKTKIKNGIEIKFGSKLKDLTEEDNKFITEVYWDKSKTFDDRIRILVEKFNVSERTIRRYCSNVIKISEKTNVIKESEHVKLAKAKEHNLNKKYFLISCAQNATKINEDFVKNMECYANHIDAEILIIPIRYHNPGSIISENDKKQEWWDAKIVKYLTLNRHKLNNNLVVFSDVKTQLTNANPLSGFESLCGDGSGILAHPRVHLKTLPVLGDEHKILLTTGICTLSNYTDTRVGKLGEFHHSYGFVVVEIVDDDKYHIRQVIAKKDGSFTDLIYNVDNEEITKINSCAALIKGDIHYGNHDEKVLNKSFNKLIPILKPNQIVVHDIFDGYSINHHEEHDWVKNYIKEKNNTNSLKREIDNLINWLKTIKHLNITVVFSNHDDFLNRFIVNSDHRKNIKNAYEYIEYAKILLDEKAPNGLIAYLINESIPEIKTLGRDDSHVVCGWELAVHGMDGINGSKGSVKQFRTLNTHIITGHTHNASRVDGALSVGTNSKLKMGYNKGMSSWIHCDVIIHHDKKAQHIFYIGEDKEFTTLF